jgi:hypothetical protein
MDVVSFWISSAATFLNIATYFLFFCWESVDIPEEVAEIISTVLVESWVVESSVVVEWAIGSAAVLNKIIMSIQLNK